MPKIYISYQSDWDFSAPTWAGTLYSPNLTNSQKIRSNLSNLCRNDRLEWRRNLELIQNAIQIKKFNDDAYIIIKNIRFVETSVSIAMIVNLSADLNYYCTFILSDSLNLDSLYCVERIDELEEYDKNLLPHERRLDVREYNGAIIDQLLKQPVAVKPAAHTKLDFKLDNIDDEDEDDYDEVDRLCSFLLASNETPQKIAQKAEKNGIEWYSFFLDKDVTPIAKMDDTFESNPEDEVGTNLTKGLN